MRVQRYWQRRKVQHIDLVPTIPLPCPQLLNRSLSFSIVVTSNEQLGEIQSKGLSGRNSWVLFSNQGGTWNGDSSPILTPNPLSIPVINLIYPPLSVIQNLGRPESLPFEPGVFLQCQTAFQLNCMDGGSCGSRFFQRG